MGVSLAGFQRIGWEAVGLEIFDEILTILISLYPSMVMKPGDELEDLYEV